MRSARNRQAAVAVVEERFQGKRASQRKLRELGLVGHSWPRHEIAYDVISGILTEFGWNPKSTAHGNVVIFDSYPTVGGKNPTLADLVVYATREPGDPGLLKFDSFPRKIEDRVLDLLALGKAGQDFVQLMLDLPAVVPPKEVNRAITGWLRRAIGGEPSTVFVGVCPDYAVDEQGRYTFEALGNDVGVVARRALIAFPLIWKFASKYRINLKFVAGIGDFEADSEEVLSRVKAGKQEFLSRLRQSQEAFRVGCGDMPVEVPFATEIGDWYQTLEQARQAVKRGEWSGAFPLSETDIDQICEARRSLYERWYGTGTDARQILERQVPEYMAMAKIAEEAFPNTLILGSDAACMAIFDHGLSDHIRPVVYMRSKAY